MTCLSSTRALSWVRLATLLTAAAMFTVACQPVGQRKLEARASDEWTRSYPLAENGEVQIVAGNGSVEVQTGAGSAVDVRAERVARAATDSTAKEIVPRIQIREDVTPEKVVIQTTGLAGIVIGVEVEVNYHVSVPPGAQVRVRTANGPITLTGLTGKVVASSANGTIEGRGLAGGIEARSVNGKVTIDLARIGEDPVDLRATNGAVQLTLPANGGATLTANCTNGIIDVHDLDFAPFGDQTKRRLRGRINGGGTPIDVTTLNGDIHVSPRP